MKFVSWRKQNSLTGTVNHMTVAFPCPQYAQIIATEGTDTGRLGRRRSFYLVFEE